MGQPGQIICCGPPLQLLHTMDQLISLRNLQWTVNCMVQFLLRNLFTTRTHRESLQGQPSTKLVHTAQTTSLHQFQGPLGTSFHDCSSIRPILVGSKSRLRHSQIHEDQSCSYNWLVCVTSCSRLVSVAPSFRRYRLSLVDSDNLFLINMDKSTYTNKCDATFKSKSPQKYIFISAETDKDLTRVNTLSW